MRIKKHASGNEFIQGGNIWVRNFTKNCISHMQISHMFANEDYSLVLNNQELNKNHPKISNETIYFENIVIVSNGYDFDKRHAFIGKLPKSTGILAVNKAVLKWKLLTDRFPPAQRRTINAYVVNNPYAECMSYMSNESKYFPACIASIRTNHEFLKKYPGDVYTYAVTPEEKFGFDLKENYYIDDYRNPICAAIDFAFRFGSKKVMLVCCDDSFADKRESAIALPNGLYTYPQHLKSQEIIDAKLHWLTNQENKKVKVADYSSGADYKNAVYINSEEEALKFFQEDGVKDVK